MHSYVQVLRSVVLDDVHRICALRLFHARMQTMLAVLLAVLLSAPPLICDIQIVWCNQDRHLAVEFRCEYKPE